MDDQSCVNFTKQETPPPPHTKPNSHAQNFNQSRRSDSKVDLLLDTDLEDEGEDEDWSGCFADLKLFPNFHFPDVQQIILQQNVWRGIVEVMWMSASLVRGFYIRYLQLQYGFKGIWRTCSIQFNFIPKVPIHTTCISLKVQSPKSKVKSHSPLEPQFLLVWTEASFLVDISKYEAIPIFQILRYATKSFSWIRMITWVAEPTGSAVVIPSILGSMMKPG